MEDLGNRDIRLISLLVLVVVVAVGYFVYRLAVLNSFKARESLKPSSSETETSERSGYISLPGSAGVKKTYRGKVLVKGPSTYAEGTHVLVDGKGNPIILLKADDDKLFLAEGRTVSVSGEVSNTSEGNMKIMRVETISFK